MTTLEIALSLIEAYQEASPPPSDNDKLDQLIAAMSRLTPERWSSSTDLVAALGRVQVEVERRALTSSPDQPSASSRLFKAEMARLSGQHWSAVELYGQAITLAAEQGCLPVQALAQELAAKFWLAKDNGDIAGLYLEKAWRSYKQVNNQAKLNDLESELSRLQPSKPAPFYSNSPATFNGAPAQRAAKPSLQIISEAWQIISSEIVLSELLKKIIKSALEYSLAERGFLILDKDERWVIEAQAEANAPLDMEVLQATPIDQQANSSLLPLSIIEHVAQTKQAVVIDDAGRSNRFNQDAYIRRKRPKSVLCTPFLSQIKLTGMLYLENSNSAGIFTPDRLEIINFLSSQAAVLIETAILYSSLESAVEKQADLINAYSRFVPPEILDFLGKDSIAQVRLGDQTQREMTVLFSDIRSFTSMSEQMTPQENFNFINNYFKRVSPIIRQHEGFVDKYIGDALMALFPGKPNQAIVAAIAMQQEVTRYNSERVKKGYQSLKIGIGLHRGSVMLGTVGEEMRMEGTVISNAVNLASRLEGLTKRYGAPIVVSEQTLFSLERPVQYNFRFLDKVKVKGKQELVAVFEIFDGSPHEVVDLKLKTRTDFEQGILHYHNQEFREAITHFNNVLEMNPQDRAAQVYLRQATHCLWIGWESVKVLTEKS